MTNKKQDSGRTMVEMIAVLILVAIITLSGIFGFSWLVQTYQKNEELKHANTVIVTLQNSRIIRKNKKGEPISIKSVVSGPKTAEEGKVMVLSDKDDYFMVVTAMGTEEYIADLQIEPGTCSEYMQAFNEHSALFDTDRISTSSRNSLLSDIQDKSSASGIFKPLSPEIIKNCEETGRFRAAFNVIGKLNEDKEVHLEGKEFIGKCPSDKKEDKNGNCCEVEKLCGDVCDCAVCDKTKNKCVECLDDSHCPNDNQTCNKENECGCKETFTSYKGECVCEPGYILKDGTCTKCAVGTYKSTYSNDTSCTTCPDGTTTSGEGSTSRTDCACGANTTLYNGKCQCEPGYTFEDGTCTQCAKGTYKDWLGNDTCKSCPFGATTEGEGSTSVNECSCDEAAGFKKDSNGECVCDPGYTPKEGICTKCAVGTYKDKSGNEPCTACAVGTFQDLEGQTSCTACEGVKANSTTDGRQKTTSAACLCKPGYYLSNTSQMCERCNTGTYKTSAGDGVCTSCSGGRTTAGTGATADTQCVCPSGQNWNGTICVTCSPYAVWSNNQCQCKAGYTGNGTTCTPCGQGTYKSSTGTGTCTACPAGTYQNGTGKTQCIGCGGGRITDSAGSTASTACKCPSGTRWSGSSCVQCTTHDHCAAGTYCNNGTCSACGAGHSCGCSWCSNGNGGCFSLDQWCKRNSDGNYSAMDGNKCGKGTCQTKDWNRSGWTKRCVTWGECWLKKDSNGDSYCNYWYSENPQSCSACGRGQACRW